MRSSGQHRGIVPAGLRPGGVRRPWTPLPKPLAECRLALVASSVCLARAGADSATAGQKPYFRIVASDVDTAALRQHREMGGGASEANLDRNIGQALDRLREAAAAGRIGRLNDRHLAFCGAMSASARVIRRKAPEAARLLLADGVDVALLVPT